MPVVFNAVIVGALIAYFETDALFTHNDELAFAARRAIDLAG